MIGRLQGPPPAELIKGHFFSLDFYVYSLVLVSLTHEMGVHCACVGNGQENTVLRDN